MDKQHYIELLSRYRENRLSKEEMIDLFDWINSTEGVNEYDQYLNGQIDRIDVDSDVFFDRRKILRDIRGKMGKQKFVTRKLAGFRKYAAILALFILGGSIFWLMKEASGEETVFAMAAGNKGSLNLSDGSVVWLNSGSRIIYNQENQRRIRLEGEAFLQVAKNEKCKFLVHTPLLDITVFGTSFNVSAYPVDSTITVSLVEGVIGISFPSDKSVTRLYPGQVARFDIRNGKLDIQDEDVADVAIWRNEELKLTDAGIRSLVRKLGAWYGVEIHLQNQPAVPSLYNITIRDESVGEILELINSITPIVYNIKNKEVYIEYKNEYINNQ